MCMCIRAAWGWPLPPHRWRSRVICTWVDHWVDQNSALTCAVTSEILCIASVTCWAGAYVRKHTPSSGTISQFQAPSLEAQVTVSKRLTLWNRTFMYWGVNKVADKLLTIIVPDLWSHFLMISFDWPWSKSHDPRFLSLFSALSVVFY